MTTDYVEEQHFGGITVWTLEDRIIVTTGEGLWFHFDFSAREAYWSDEQGDWIFEVPIGVDYELPEADTRPNYFPLS